MSASSSRRFLFVAPPFVSHINPIASIAQELTLRGHTVVWLAYKSMRPYLPAGAVVHAGTQDEAFEKAIRDVQANSRRPTADSLRLFWEDVIAPLARAMLPDVEDAISACRPDVLVADQYALAGAFAARKHKLVWATSSPSAQLLTNALDSFPSGKEWLLASLARLQTEAGLDPIVEWPDRSPYLLLLYATREFVGEDLDLPEHYRLVGPAIGHRPDDSTFPWEQLTGAPLVFVTLGTLFRDQGERFFAALVQALADQPVQVIVSTLPELLPDKPSNFIVQRWVPLQELFPRLDAVICHAGTTAYESLAHGVPLVVAPMAYDQFTIAYRIAEAGAGVRVRFRRVGPSELRQAVLSVLQSPSYKEAALRIQTSFQQAGGASAAATALEALP